MPGAAAEPGPTLGSVISTIDRHGVARLGDDQELCLEGLWFPISLDRELDARDGREVLDQDRSEARFAATGAYNRYGCRIVDLESRNGRMLGEELIRAGLAAVDPSSARLDDAVIDALLALEDEARQARRGLWQDPATHPKDAGNLKGSIGVLQMVEGDIRRVSGNDRYVYLNFGADWRTDFTVRLRRKLAEANGFDHETMKGRKLRVRGVLQESRGPLIDIINTQQIEFLP